MTNSRPSPVPRFFDVVARLYDLKPVQRVMYRPAQDEVIAALRADKPARVLDVGCGTGQLTARIAAELDAETVCGCDMSAGMLAQAAARAGDVHWLQGPAEEIALPDGSVDAVVSTHAFHFFDHPRALAEFHRLLAPGGRLVIAMISPRAKAAGRAQRVTGKAFGHAYFPTQSELTSMIRDAGFRIDSQRRATRPLGRLVPDLVTVATRVP